MSFRLIPLTDVPLSELVELLNIEQLRVHLMPHAMFDREGAESWRADKMQEDSLPHSFIRAVQVQDSLAGWCGIQKCGLEEGGEHFELAIVLAPEFWGIGKAICACLLETARQLGHRELRIHFLHTRPPYRFMEKLALRVYDSEINGNRFKTYVIPTEC